MEKSSIQRTVKSLLNMRYKINFELPFQREFVWSDQRGSLFMQTIMINSYVWPILIWENGDVAAGPDGKEEKVQHVVDGKQRWSFLFRFIDNQVALTADTPAVRGIEVAGKRFSELPESIQFDILTFNFTVTKFTEATLEEIEEIFYRVNQPHVLSDVEVSWVKLGEANREVIRRFTSSILFEKISFNSKDKKHRVDGKLVFKIIALVMDKGIGFSAAELKRFINEIGKNPIAPNVVDTIEKTVTFMEAAFRNWDGKLYKRGLKKGHVPNLFMAAIHAQSMGWSADQFGEWSKSFLIERYSKESEYGQTMQSKTSNKEVIARGRELMIADLDEFVL